MSIFKKIKKKVKKTGEGVADAAKHAAQHPADVVKHPKQIIHVPKQAASQAVDAVEDEAGKLVKAALGEALSSIAAGALKQALKLIEITAPSHIDFKLGPVGLAVDDVPDRLDTIKSWVGSPPKNTDGLRKMIETLAPSSVSIEISVSLALVVVSSDSLELGTTLIWETDDFLERFKELLGGIQ